MQDFFEAVENFKVVQPSTPSSEDVCESNFTILTAEGLEEISTQMFQNELGLHHIIIQGSNLVEIPCNYRGLTSLNSLKEIVNMEGKFLYTQDDRSFTHSSFKDQSTVASPQLEKRSLKQFIDNLNAENPNILRIVRMKSYSGFDLTEFSSDHAAWRGTMSDPSSVMDDMSHRSRLRWTDVSMKNSVQFWRMVPAGFGAFFDIRCGQLWIIVANPELDAPRVDREYFTRWDRYTEGFNRLLPTFSIGTRLEAIRLEPGIRL